MTEEQIINNLKKLRGQVTFSQQERETGLSLYLQKVDKYFIDKESKIESKKTRTGFLISLRQKVLVFNNSLQDTRQVVINVLNFYASHIVASVLITILVFGAIGAYTGIEARKALPDNKPLYTLKTALEKAQLNLSFSASKKTEVRANLFTRRADELDRLVEKTVANPKHDGVAVIASIKNTTEEVLATKEDLVSATQKKNRTEITELADLVGEKVHTYQIALSDAHEELPDYIKDEIGPDVQALSSAISEINLVIKKIGDNESVKGVSDTNLFDLGTTTDDSLIEDSLSTTTSVTTTDSLIDTTATDTSVFIPKAEEIFTTEKDTFEVRIGN